MLLEMKMKDQNIIKNNIKHVISNYIIEVIGDDIREIIDIIRDGIYVIIKNNIKNASLIILRIIVNIHS